MSSTDALIYAATHPKEEKKKVSIRDSHDKVRALVRTSNNFVDPLLESRV